MIETQGVKFKTRERGWREKKKWLLGNEILFHSVRTLYLIIKLLDWCWFKFLYNQEEEEEDLRYLRYFGFRRNYNEYLILIIIVIKKKLGKILYNSLQYTIDKIHIQSVYIQNWSATDIVFSTLFYFFYKFAKSFDLRNNLTDSTCFVTLLSGEEFKG